MAFGKTFILCSHFSGTAVTEEDKPAAGIEIERKWFWSWNDKSGTERTVTDKNGKFEFGVVEGSSFSALFLPHEPNILQTITAHTSNGDVEIWHARKDSYEINSEMDGNPIEVICHLDKEPSPDGLYWGTCVEGKK